MLKELLKLTSKSEAAAWSQVEACISSLKISELFPHVASLSNAELG